MAVRAVSSVQRINLSFLFGFTLPAGSTSVALILIITDTGKYIGSTVTPKGFTVNLWHNLFTLLGASLFYGLSYVAQPSKTLGLLELNLSYCSECFSVNRKLFLKIIGSISQSIDDAFDMVTHIAEWIVADDFTDITC
jgi:hypothetical protein